LWLQTPGTASFLNQAFCLSLENRQNNMDFTPSVAGAEQGSKTILLVDDQKTLLRAVREGLEMSGYQVLTADNGQEALSLYAERKDNINLIITDFAMPGMNGVALMTALRNENPHLKTIIMTGDLALIAIPSHPLHQADIVLPKPFRLPHLLDSVATLLHD
jgi:CheY-like chemotaxis protein